MSGDLERCLSPMHPDRRTPNRPKGPQPLQRDWVSNTLRPVLADWTTPTKDVAGATFGS